MSSGPFSTFEGGLHAWQVDQEDFAISLKIGTRMGSGVYCRVLENMGDMEGGPIGDHIPLHSCAPFPSLLTFPSLFVHPPLRSTSLPLTLPNPLANEAHANHVTRSCEA